MRNKLLHISGMVILFSLFSSLSMGFSEMDGFHGQPDLNDRAQLHGYGRATAKLKVELPALLQDAEEGAEKSESTTEPGPAEPDKDTTRPKAPGESGTLTPFKPSEEIRADQAVDFPYDI